MIEHLKETIAEMRSDLEKKRMETVKDEDEDDIVRKFEECFVQCFILSQRCIIIVKYVWNGKL